MTNPTVQRNLDRDELETLVDRLSLSEVVDILAELASAKADHILANWQDEKLSDQWDQCAACLLNASETIRQIGFY